MPDPLHGANADFVYFIGNPGSGMSFLANVLAQRNAFQRSPATPCCSTAAVSSADLPRAIVDVRGIFAAGDTARTQETCAALSAALGRPGKSIMCYVIAPINGRIRHEDVECIELVRGFLRASGNIGTDGAECVAVNQVPVDDVPDIAEYQQACCALMRSCGIPASLRLAFLPVLTDPRPNKGLADFPYSHPNVVSGIRDPLVQMLSRLVPLPFWRLLPRPASRWRPRRPSSNAKHRRWPDWLPKQPPRKPKRSDSKPPPRRSGS